MRFFLLKLIWLVTSKRIVSFFDPDGQTDPRTVPGLEGFREGHRLLFRWSTFFRARQIFDTWFPYWINVLHARPEPPTDWWSMESRGNSYLSMSSCVVVLFNLFLVFLLIGSFETDWSTDWSTDKVDRDLVDLRDIRLVFVLKFRIEAKVSFSRFYDS